MAEPVGQSHGLHCCIHDDKVRKFAPQMASHIFCCYVKLGAPHIAAAIRATDAVMRTQLHAPEEGESIEEWVVASERASRFVQTLEFLWPWVATETDLALADFLRADVVRVQTVAPEQLLFQWWCERFLMGLEWLLERNVAVTEADEAGVKEVFDAGQDLLRARAKGRIRLVPAGGSG